MRVDRTARLSDFAWPGQDLDCNWSKVSGVITPDTGIDTGLYKSTYLCNKLPGHKLHKYNVSLLWSYKYDRADHANRIFCRRLLFLFHFSTCPPFLEYSGLVGTDGNQMFIIVPRAFSLVICKMQNACALLSVAECKHNRTYPGCQRFFSRWGGDRIERRSREGESQSTTRSDAPGRWRARRPLGRFPFSQKFWKLRFGAKWKTFFRFARLDGLDFRRSLVSGPGARAHFPNSGW